MLKKIEELENFSLPFYDVKNQLGRYVYGRSIGVFASGDRARDLITNKDQVELRQQTIREKLIESVGGLPSSDTPLNPVVTGTMQFERFRVEKVIFESRSKVYVTTNLYLPDNIQHPSGAVLFLCGHHDQGKHHPEYQRVCQYLTEAGLIVLAMDPLGQGERFGYYEGADKKVTVRPSTGEHDHVGTQCLPLGDGLARYFIHDAMRAIDYLMTRPEVDQTRIGVTGNSGGGTQTSLMMMCDPRIVAAVPATFIMNRETYLYAGGAQDAEQIWRGFSSNGFDHEDILIAMVPRPVLVLASQYDYFPIEGTRRTVARTQRFWEMYRKPGNIQLYEDTCIHKYSDSMATMAAQFFSEHLNGNKIQHTYEPNVVEPSLLWCTISGQVRGDFSDSCHVIDDNKQRVEVLANRRAQPALEHRKTIAYSWLSEKVYQSRMPCDINVRCWPFGQVDEMNIENCFWWSQAGILNQAFLFRHVDRLNSKLPVTIALWDEGTNGIRPHIDWLRETCCTGRAVLVLNVTGMGCLLPNPVNSNHPLHFYGVIHKYTDDLIWLDDSLAALRIYDVIRCIDMLDSCPNVSTDEIHLYSYGRVTFIALLAAFLEKRIHTLNETNGFGVISDWIGMRHYDSYDILGTILPGCLHYFDLSDLRQWIQAE